MSFITNNFNFYDIQEKYDSLGANLETELKEIIDKISMAIYAKIDMDCYEYVEQFNRIQIAFQIDSIYNNYKKSYHTIVPNSTFTDMEEKDENKGKIQNYLHYNLKIIVDNEIKDLAKIYHIYSFFKKPENSLFFSFNACHYYELYKEIEDAYSQKENLFPLHFTTHDALMLMEGQLDKIKISLFLDLVSKYGNDVSIQLKRDINNNLSKELIFPFEYRNQIQNEWAYQKLIELNKHFNIEKETINLTTFEQIEKTDINDYFKQQSKLVFSYYERNLIINNLDLKDKHNNIKKRI